MPPPVLVIEVVSSGAENRSRDYRYKRTEYAARGGAEYWIIDPEQGQITICKWVKGRYEDTVITDETIVASSVIPTFQLTAAQILGLGQSKSQHP